ncbi:hypothetical protein [Pendulispora albinea]|uniref:DUF3617 family protein n=1 Tax=Pendulispora albinea TaxID=2741071 RepID=A0ABZ2LXU5_9BACT
MTCSIVIVSFVPSNEGMQFLSQHDPTLVEGLMFKKWGIAVVVGLAVASLGMTVGNTAFAADDEIEEDPSAPSLLADPFVGTWNFQSGSQISSPCLSTPIDLNTRSADITPGASAGEVVANVQGCKIPFVETDATHAKLKATTSCTLTEGGTSYNVRITSATLALASNGVLSVNGAGTANIFCSVKLTGTAVK